MRLGISLLAITLACAPLAQAAEVVVSPGQEPELTIYNGDFGLVREHRTARLTETEARLAFTGVSRNLQPETAALEIGASDKLKPSDVRILDQTFAFNLMSSQALLEQSVGKDVSIVTTNPATGRDSTERAKVLSVQNGVVLDIGGKIYTGAPGRIVFDGLPGNLRATPTLLVTVAAPTGADIPIDLSYLTAGLGWRADYVAAFDADSNRLDLTGWATITNTTGIDFKSAKLKLAAGQVNRVSVVPRPMMMANAVAAAPRAAEAQNVAPESVGGLDLYTIVRPVTLASGETKQLALMRVVGLPVKRDLVVHSQASYFSTAMPGQKLDSHVDVEVVVKNDRPKVAKPKTADPNDVPGLGAPLPAGVVRAYGQDSDGAPQFLGEDRISGVPEGAEMRLRLGQDADVAVTREQTSFARATDSISISGWRVTIHNGKAKPVSVRIAEPVSGNWDVPKETQPHTKNDAGLPEWTVNVPAKGQMVLEYALKSAT